MEWLEPWMLHADWRAVDHAWLCVDLDRWPADLAIDPPPFPLIGVGDPHHPQAVSVDSFVAPGTTNHQAAAVIVQLLRSIEGMPLDAALTCESLAFATLQGGTEHRAWLARQTPEPAPPGELHLHRDGSLLAVTIDRPPHNAIDRAMRDALFDAFALAAADPDITRVTLRGAGRCFSMGADLAEFGTVANPTEAHLLRMRTLPARALIRRPDIYEAHVQGGCVGSGLELAAFAARLTASADAWFQLPELAMGILPGAGGCVSLSRRIGRQRTAAMILSGRRINARTALDWGLIDAIVDHAPVDHRHPHPIG